MAAFAYEAVEPSGRTAKGIVEAASATAARQVLRDRQLMPVSVSPTKTKGPHVAARRRLRGRVGYRALTLFTRQLSTLIGSGIGIEEALRIVAEQTRSPTVSALLLNLRASILDGRSFAQALDEAPEVFGDYYRASVAAGETSGRLEEVMDHLAGFVEARARNRQTIQLALLYPAILGLVSLAVIVALLTFVVPDIVRVFTTRGADLPLLTRGLIGLSEAATSWGPLAAAVLAGAVAGVAALLRRPAIRRRWHAALATVPLVRGFVLKANAAQFAGTMATLTVSRVPLVDALAAATATVPNLHVRGRVEAAAARVREGMALSRALAAANVFPPMLVAMVASGEASGGMGDALTRAAEAQDRELAAVVAALVALVEPGVLLLMGGIVMLLVLAILLPIVNLNDLVG